MNYLAVDFSLNSPGVCLYNDKSKKYHFISYMKPGTGTKKDQKLQEEMSLLKDVTLVSQPGNIGFTLEKRALAQARQPLAGWLRINVITFASTLKTFPVSIGRARSFLLVRNRTRSIFPLVWQCGLTEKT